MIASIQATLLIPLARQAAGASFIWLTLSPIWARNTDFQLETTAANPASDVGSLMDDGLQQLTAA